MRFWCVLRVVQSKLDVIFPLNTLRAHKHTRHKLVFVYYGFYYCHYHFIWMVNGHAQPHFMHFVNLFTCFRSSGRTCVCVCVWVIVEYTGFIFLKDRQKFSPHGQGRLPWPASIKCTQHIRHTISCLSKWHRFMGAYSTRLRLPQLPRPFISAQNKTSAGRTGRRAQVCQSNKRNLEIRWFYQMSAVDYRIICFCHF